MVKLSQNIRRVGGDLESIRSPYAKRLLLPTEIELCETLGISEDEYWLFEEKISAISSKRNEAYELIPDIRSDAVLAYQIGSTTVGAILGNVAIAAAISYVGYLLTPKPRPIKGGVTTEGSDCNAITTYGFITLNPRENDLICVLRFV